MSRFAQSGQWQTTLPQISGTSSAARPVRPVRLVALVVLALLGCVVWAHLNSQPSPAFVSEAYVASRPFVGPPRAKRLSKPRRFTGPVRPLAVEPEPDLEATMFPTRLHGPYALRVRDGLNEMVIETNLVAQGIEGASTNAQSRDALLAAIPSHLPALGLVTSEFGTRHSPFTTRIVHHNGVDISVEHGDPVFATADGIVTYAGWRKAFGRIVVINHGYGIVTKYAHNSQLLYRTGDSVRRGDVIARAGSTGQSTGTHVHYEVWVNGRAIDPTSFMFDVPQRNGDAAEQSLAMARMEHATRSKSFVGPHEPSTRAAEDEGAMGGEVELSDAPEMGSVTDLPRPDPKQQLGLNGAILSIFAALCLMVVLLSRPRAAYV